MNSSYRTTPTPACKGKRKAITRRIIPPRTTPDLTAAAKFLSRLSRPSSLKTEN